MHLERGTAEDSGDHYGQEVIISGVKLGREPKIETKERGIRPSNIDLLNYCLAKED